MFRCLVLLLWEGGLEIHFKSNIDPFDMVGGEVLDVDAIFKSEYDQSTYSLFIGCVRIQCIDITQTLPDTGPNLVRRCGGCVPMVDPIVIPPISLNGYEHGELEPFTQVCSIFNV